MILVFRSYQFVSKEEVLPLLFFHYPFIFRSSFLSDTAHQKMNIKDYYSTKQQILAAIIEKKVEIWHSLLRDSIERHYTAEQMRLNAKFLNINKTQQEFRKHFVPEYLRGTGEKDQTLLGGRSAEFLINKLQLIAKNLHSPNSGKLDQKVEEFSYDWVN